MRVLVTNDDGVRAPGLHVLAAALIDAGHEVVVAAPAHDCSGQGAALGPLHLTGEVTFERLRVEGVAVELIAVEGPPALAVMAACLGGFGVTPDVVVSGINAGANTGRAVLHSGTVGAALTGLNLGRPGLAVSQAAGEPFHWAAAASIAVSLVDRIPQLTRPVVINLNVPNCDRHRVRGVVTASLDPGGRVQATMTEDRRGVLQLSIPDRRKPAAGTDNALLDDGYATVTALAGPHSVGLPLEALWAVEPVAPGIPA